MSFDFDSGSQGSQGPWISWSARGTQDGTVPPKSFLLREDGGHKSPFAGFERGVVLDIFNMKTGWQRSEGVAGQAPDWKWNATVSRMEPAPGEDYKKGFSIPCAIGEGKTATWEQAGTAAWQAFADLVPAIQQGPGDQSLPMVRLKDTKALQFKRGSTVLPILEIVKWVPRPDCLKEGYAIQTEEAPAPQAQPAPQPSDVPDDVAF